MTRRSCSSVDVCWPITSKGMARRKAEVKIFIPANGYSSAELSKTRVSKSPVRLMTDVTPIETMAYTSHSDTSCFPTMHPRSCDAFRLHITQSDSGELLRQLDIQFAGRWNLMWDSPSRCRGCSDIRRHAAASKRREPTPPRNHVPVFRGA